MSDAHSTRQTEAVRKHEHLDPATVVEDVKDLFEPENHMIPPLNPDTPPTEADADEAQG
jgi:hypothetical protein